ncbi:hypothetical protein Dshi_3160 [Dinoroseobacter shibae DFL 12 = DSM 16493]|jgi:hypothetical protein|uniref:Transmembrane protein n=1 Tax=Dinoroseobacter shibae (strain DSM 16493 / NCIMB 14021 / DFL 12) TaxID=398580 RepID=A8LLY4_DINSH|nr:hypothetical protein [Dinoroseobacter shibae]ABV94893.1 hypothetical protein Dshi_3160 [Dinoroseobacter shibae DFL 12 = DSM 16493]URF46314.1 hypothetical protein M8008_16260 [Dinoroseobacter shibae]URF50620.1 hypothetical protein M8007_16260 [Dinoroseobacter shibae]
MLDLLGTIGGNALSLPGILGLALGMMTRNWRLAAILGGVVGVVETLIFAGFTLDNIYLLDAVVAVVVGMVAGTLGCAIRNKGATV